MAIIDLSRIKQLPVSDRLAAVEDIWNSIANETGALEVPAWHRDVLTKRLAEYRANPTDGAPFAEVRRVIEGERKSRP